MGWREGSGKRNRGRLILPALALAAVLAVIPANHDSRAETAREITMECEIVPGSKKKTFGNALDRSYQTYWNSYAGKGASITVTVPEGEEASGVWIQYYDHPHATAVQVRDENGEWTEAAATEGIFLSDYLALPAGTKEFRVANPRSARKSTPIPVAEFHVYGKGDLPPEVQVWEPPAEKADLMLLSAHPDDEILWFGGVLPVYAGVEKKAVQVCTMVPTLPRRRLEELDGLWTCGVRNYPVFGRYQDSFSLSLRDQYSRWDSTAVLRTVTGWIRQFQPEVIISHDLGGEYGHGAHRACADAVIRALEVTNNPKKFLESWEKYGGWDVPKCYFHLYPENVIDFDWRVPLEAFGGRTAFEVATEAFACHISQQETEYRVEDWGPCDCSLFGLYRSLVGPDEEHNDLFENLRPQLRDEE
ncbi:MAG: PIG-L family deacetylase [Clostridia bacterium]|nr:PIG-L family deacetylase [Clostridia bacterium]